MIRAVVLTLCATVLQAPAQDPVLTKLLRDARSKDSLARLAAYDELAKRGEDGKKLLLPILREAEARATTDFLSLARGSEASSFKRQLRSDIASAREAALAIIRDGKLYPDDAHGAVGQPLVDDKVARLRELWIRPSRRFAEAEPEVNVRLYYIKEATQWIKKIGAKPDRFESPDHAFAELDEQFDGKELVYDKGELKEIEAVYEANATGPSVASDEERRFARILNDYRVMLGLAPLRLEDALVLAARKHSQEMNDLDYFAHESPVEANRSPSDRARKEGFSGSVLENCAISGDAEDAFDGWYRSSGHHRGLIANMNKLGPGQSVLKGGARGRHWTMLAGTGTGPKAKDTPADPRARYLARKQNLREGDVETRFQLARYCLKHEMQDEARELFDDVLRIDAEHKETRKALGHVKREGVWLTPEEQILRDLQDKGPEAAIAAATSRLAAPDPATRRAAVLVLATTGDKRAAPPLVKALGDKASEVRVAACDALGKLEAKESVEPLSKALADQNFYVAHAAASVLWRFGDRRGVSVLFVGLRSPDLNHRLDAHKRARSAFGEDFGYAWDLPEVERAKVVDRWEAWVKDLKT